MFFDEFTLSIIGILASITILSGWIPQIVRGYRTRKLDDVSKYLMSLIAIGAFLWLLYGIEKEDPFIMGVNIAAIILSLIVLGMKFKYERKLKIPK